MTNGQVTTLQLFRPSHTPINLPYNLEMFELKCSSQTCHRNWLVTCTRLDRQTYGAQLKNEWHWHLATVHKTTTCSWWLLNLTSVTWCSQLANAYLHFSSLKVLNVKFKLNSICIANGQVTTLPPFQLYRPSRKLFNLPNNLEKAETRKTAYQLLANVLSGSTSPSCTNVCQN